jgi:hypothetical protein
MEDCRYKGQHEAKIEVIKRRARGEGEPAEPGAAPDRAGKRHFQAYSSPRGRGG